MYIDSVKAASMVIPKRKLDTDRVRSDIEAIKEQNLLALKSRITNEMYAIHLLERVGV